MFKYIRYLLLLFGIVGWCTFLSGQSGFLKLDTQITDPSGCYISDGSIEIEVLNGTPPYQYSLDGGTTYSSSSNSFSGLGSGSYLLLVKDAEEKISSFVYLQLAAINAPLIDGISFQNPTSCGIGGTITIEARGGEGALAYSIDGGQSFQNSSVFTDVPQGVYNIVVSNQDGFCPSTHPVINYTPAESSRFIQGTVSAQEPDCDTNNGSIEISITGLASDYTFSIDGGATFQDQTVYENLAHGNYSVIAKHKQTNCQKELEQIEFSQGDCLPPTLPCDALIQDQVIEISNCEDQIAFCLNFPIANLEDYRIYVDGELSMQQVAVCSAQNLMASLNFNKGRYLIQLIHKVSNCESSAFLTVSCNTVNEAPCNIFESQSRELLGEPERSVFCLGIPINKLYKYDIFLNGQFVNQRVTSCTDDAEKAALVLGEGRNTIMINQIGVCRDINTVDISNNFNPNNPTFCDNLVIPQTLEVYGPNDKTTYCLNIPIVCKEGYSILLNGVTPTTEVLTCSNNFEALGLLLGVGEHHISVTHENQTCWDSGIITVKSTAPQSRVCQDQIQDANLILEEGVDQALYCLNIPFDSLEVYDIIVDGITIIDSCSENSNLAGFLLSEGTYNIEISHRFINCSASAKVQVFREECATDPACCDSMIADSSIEIKKPDDLQSFCLNIPIQEIENYTILVNGVANTQSIIACREDTTLVGLQLERGNYQINISHLNGICEDNASVTIFVEGDIPPDDCNTLIGDSIYELAENTTTYSFCLNIPLTKIGDYTITNNGVPVNSSFPVCPSNTSIAAVELSEGVHDIQITHNSEMCTDQATITIRPFNPCTNLLQDGVFQLTHVSGKFKFCLGIAEPEISNYTILVEKDGQIVIPTTSPCAQNPDLIALELAPGMYSITIAKNDGTCQDNATVRVDSPFSCESYPNNDEIIDVMDCDLPHVYCLGLPFEQAASFNISVDGDTTIPFTPCSNPLQLGVALEVGTHQVVLSNETLGCSDTASVTIRCLPPSISILMDTLPANGTDTICINTNLLNGNITSIENGCPEKGNDIINFTIDTTSLCVVYTSTGNAGLGEACIVICDDNGECGTVNVGVTVMSDDEMSDSETPFMDSLMVNETDTFCLDSTQLPGTLTSVTNTCPEESGDSISFTIDPITNCIIYSALGEGSGKACLTMCDEQNNCIEKELIITSANPRSSTSFINTIAVNQTDTFCIDSGKIPGAIVSINNTCPNQAGTAVSFTLDTINFCVIYQGLAIGSGTACISICDNENNCDTTEVSISVIEPSFSFSDTVTINKGDTFCLDTTQLSGTITSIENTCPSQAGTAVSFAVDTDTYCVIYTGLEEGTGVACIRLCDDTNSCTTTEITIISSEPKFSVNDSIRINQMDTVCIDTSQLTGTIISIENTCPDQAGTAVAFDIDTSSYCVIYTGLEEGTGTACIRICDDTNSCTNTEITITSYEPKFIINDSIRINQMDTVCIDTTQLTGTITSIENTCPDQPSTAVSFNIDTSSYCIIYTGLEEGTDSICIRICDDTNSCTTTEIIITSYEPKFMFIDSIETNKQDTFCLDTMELPGNIISMTNECPDSMESTVTFMLDTINYCVIYSAMEEGTGEACIRLCDDQNNCTTTEIIISAMEKQIEFTNSIPINTADTLCIDTTQLDGTIVSIINTCADLSGESIIFNIDTTTYCISYTGMEVGMGTACIRVCDDQGICFTTEMTITAFDPRQVFETTIFVGNIDTFCIDTTLVIGPITSIKNICPEEADSIVQFTIDTLTRCIIYEGLEIGTGKSCIEVCNMDNQCDTVNLTINVRDSIMAPIAVADRDTVNAGETIVLNVLENDTLSLDSVEITIVAMPPNGNTIVNPDGTISYQPNDNFCDTTDIFMYQVCNTGGCDTARVTIYIQCTNLEILGGFSPNGDGVNDTFIINGIAGFPMNRLQIFDRRGTRVFNASPYNNDWDGTWGGKTLPSGIYFYLLEDGKGNEFSGYVVLRR